MLWNNVDAVNGIACFNILTSYLLVLMPLSSIFLFFLILNAKYSALHNSEKANEENIIIAFMYIVEFLKNKSNKKAISILAKDSKRFDVYVILKFEFASKYPFITPDIFDKKIKGMHINNG